MIYYKYSLNRMNNKKIETNAWNRIRPINTETKRKDYTHHTNTYKYCTKLFHEFFIKESKI